MANPPYCENLLNLHSNESISSVRKHNVSSLALHPAWRPFSAVRMAQEFLYFTLRLMTGEQENNVSAQFNFGKFLFKICICHNSTKQMTSNMKGQATSISWETSSISRLPFGSSSTCPSVYMWRAAMLFHNCPRTSAPLAIPSLTMGEESFS